MACVAMYTNEWWCRDSAAVESDDASEVDDETPAQKRFRIAKQLLLEMETTGSCHDVLRGYMQMLYN